MTTGVRGTLLRLLVPCLVCASIARSDVARAASGVAMAAVLVGITVPGLRGGLALLSRLATGRGRLVSYAPVATIALLVLGFLRSARAGTISSSEALLLSGLWVALLLAGSCLAAERDGRRRRASCDAILDSIEVYAAVNVGLWLLRVPPLGEAVLHTGRATMLDLVGIQADRAMFPLATGVNGFGIMAGLAAAVALARLERGASPARWPHATALVLALAALVLSDSRGALAGVLLVAAALRFPRTVHRDGALRPVLLALPLLPLAVTSLTEVTREANLAVLSRGETLLSHREMIWHHGLANLTLGGVLKGWGYLGHVQSGMSDRYYAHLFVHLGTSNPERVSLHNSPLQLVVDGGLLLLALVGVLVLVLMARTRGAALTPHRAMVLYLMIVSGLEVTLTPYYVGPFVAVVLLAWILPDGRSPVLPALREPGAAPTSAPQPTSSQLVPLGGR